VAEENFIKTVRKSIFNARILQFGVCLTTTGVLIPAYQVDRYFPQLQGVLLPAMGTMVVAGLFLQFWSSSRSTRSDENYHVRDWIKSLPETRRRLNVFAIALTYMTTFMLGLMMLGIDQGAIVDYHAIISMGVPGLLWVMFFTELLLPRRFERLPLGQD
jgi:hypothetical protein